MKPGTVFRYAYTTLDLHTGDNARRKQNVITVDGMPSFNLWMGIVVKAFYKLHWEEIQIWGGCPRLPNQTCGSMSLRSKETSLQFPEIKEFMWSFFSEWTRSSSLRCLSTCSCCLLNRTTYRLTWRTTFSQPRHTCCPCLSPWPLTPHLLPQIER